LLIEIIEVAWQYPLHFSLRLLRQFCDVHELPGINARPGRYLPQVLKIGGAVRRAIFHPLGEEFGPLCYLGRISKMSSASIGANVRASYSEVLLSSMHYEIPLLVINQLLSEKMLARLGYTTELAKAEREDRGSARLEEGAFRDLHGISS
jgi:hypothetical protein